MLPTHSGSWEPCVSKQNDLPVSSRRLREARQAAGLSQRNLGIEAGLDAFVASTRVNRYETGVHQPDLQTIARLAEVLHLPVAYFYAEDDRLAALILGFHRGDRKLKEKLSGLVEGDSGSHEASIPGHRKPPRFRSM